MRSPQPFTAKLAGTGAAINVACGFQPKLVIAINLTQLSITYWTDTMDQAKGVQIDDSGSNATDVLALASNGISTHAQGFRLGTNAALNTSADVIHVIAM